MLCEVLEAIPTRRGTLRPGQVIDLPDDVVDRLRGKVRPADPGDLPALIGETMLVIDRRGRPWTGWRQSLTAKHRQALKEAESEIDRAALANDLAGVLAGLEQYRKLTIDHKENTKYESL